MFTNMRRCTCVARSHSVATMLLLLLLLPTLLPRILQSLELTTEDPDPPKTLQKSIKDCPSVGYFFERQDLPGHPATCYLCYCKDDGFAGCALRDSERCDGDDDSYQKDVEAVQQNDQPRSRTRRNPGLMELFFNDAKKDAMMKSMVRANEEDCKPKDSKSIGCPPKDWCKGCLVCDCDDNSEWQCHVMSFCNDKTPRPIAKKYKKPETKENDEKNKITTKTNKKTDKRSSKPKKKNPKKVSSTTTSKPPTTTKNPQIAVKTLKKFIRKDQLKNGSPPLLVIKKYISTISPIDSPELLKYKNDSRKLAQILYQQYEASTKASRTAKREIKLEKILNTKPKRNFELKYNARGRKPMNVKEHSNWNKKMKSKIMKRDNKNRKNFYWKQNALMNPNVINEMEVQEDEEKEDSKIKGNYKRKEKVIYIPRKRRNKRNVPATTVVPNNLTVLENEYNEVNMPSVNSDKVPEPTARVFRNNEETESNLNNYKYTVDDMGTQTYNYDNGAVNKDTIYETTLKYADMITMENRYYDKENLTHTFNYTIIDDEQTTKQLNYDSQSHDFKDYTLSEITDSLVSELKLINNQSLETTTSIDYTLDVTSMSDNENKGKKNTGMETTTIKDYTTIGWPTTEKQKINNYTNETQYTPINNNETETDIKQVTITDIKRIIIDLNAYYQEKNIKSNKTNITSRPKHTSMNRTLKSFKTDFAKMLQSLSNHDSKNKPQQNGIIAIKYLKKLYTQLLSNKNNNTRLNNIIVMESICDNFGPCKISTSKVRLIHYKINELITEAKKALDVIKTIKDHLQLVDNKNNNTDNLNEEVEFKKHVKQLNAIITDNYETPLTETEMTEMSYIKNETKVFINSVANFASILNDILKIIHSEKIKYDSIRKRHKLIINRMTRHKVDNEPLHKIKSLFLKFNMLQNTFMRNMYQAILELERQNNKTPIEVDNNKSGQRDKRYKTSVHKYMNKINYNLEKLKGLALKMGAKQRQKRNTMRSYDAVDYLLTLMEYLLKQNNPVDNPPVADGIDLLIDAIKRAPDIKPIKKNAFKQMSSMLLSPYYKSSSKSSSESEDDNIKDIQENLTENLSFEKPYSNDTLILTSANDELEIYKRPTSDVPHPSVTTTRYVDIEDMVFNGEVVQKVYMATGPAHGSTDAFPEKVVVPTSKPTKVKSKINESGSKEEVKKAKQKQAKSKINESGSSPEDETVIMRIKTNTEIKAMTKSNTSTTETTIKTQFDRINEEYEKEMKAKPPTAKNLNTKRKKSKRLRKKQKVESKDMKSDISSITKEADEEKTRKKVVAEEAILRKRIIAADVDPFQSMDDESISRDIAPLDANENEVFSGYFTK